jgi:pteridine reductase
MNRNHPIKIALVTGAARRIGAEIVRMLHSRGVNIALHYHASKKEAEQLSDELNHIRQKSVKLFCCDLNELASLNLLINHVISEWGQLDIVVNNASRFYKTPVDEINVENWDDLMNANLRAPLFLSQAAVPYLAKTQGVIINITDIHGDRPMRDYPVYCISKAGLIMLTRALAVELGPAIRVNGVSPGAIIWPEGENALSSELKEKIISRTALQRHGSAEEIAKAVLYFVEAEYVTGQIIAVDGGRSLTM